MREYWLAIAVAATYSTAAVLILTDLASNPPSKRLKRFGSKSTLLRSLVMKMPLPLPNRLWTYAKIWVFAFLCLSVLAKVCIAIFH
jgi:hypothetical protein